MSSAIQFSSFNTRLITYLIILLLTVLSSVFLSVNRSTYNNTRVVIDQNLEVGLEVFSQLIDERSENFKATIRALSMDFAFRTAYENSDYETLLSVADNLLTRMKRADMLLMVDYDYLVVADSLRQYASGAEFPWPWLLEEADGNDNFETSSFIVLDNIAYHIVAVPILTPLVEGWVIVGERLDNEYTASLKEVINSDISILVGDDFVADRLIATTLTQDQAKALTSEFGVAFSVGGASDVLNLADEHFITLGTSLLNRSELTLTALVQQSLPDALAPYRQLEQQLIILFVMGLLVSVTMALLLGKSITRPVLKLASRVQKIERGDYSSDVASTRKDEIGHLENSVNNMATGLAEREKVRALLGKVVSREIAEELMNRPVALGGETRTATILFSDIRDFTSICEGRTPENILEMLNAYLSEVSVAIEDNKGVVDKYIGDAVMALFGVPVTGTSDTVNALTAALAMRDRVHDLNQDNRIKGLPLFFTGIGLHTGEVVAGNLGSANRMNYTVIGDTVNLASRLESLTKQYGVGILVSDETMRDQTAFVFRELDVVKVKGKAKPVRIFELVCRREIADEQLLQEITAFESALSSYRLRDWQAAQEKLRVLQRKQDLPLYKLFLERVDYCIASPPDPTWDGVFTFQSK